MEQDPFGFWEKDLNTEIPTLSDEQTTELLERMMAAPPYAPGTTVEWTLDIYSMLGMLEGVPDNRLREATNVLFSTAARVMPPDLRKYALGYFLNALDFMDNIDFPDTDGPGDQ